MQAPARITDAIDQLTLDEAVHVFVWSGDPRRIATTLLENLAQGVDDGRRIGSRQYSRGGKRLRPGDAAGDIIFKERAVEAERDAEVERGGIGSCIEATGPECHARFTTSVLRPTTVQPPLRTDKRTTPERSPSAARAVCSTMAAGAS